MVVLIQCVVRTLKKLPTKPRAIDTTVQRRGWGALPRPWGTLGLDPWDDGPLEPLKPSLWDGDPGTQTMGWWSWNSTHGMMAHGIKPWDGLGGYLGTHPMGRDRLGKMLDTSTHPGHHLPGGNVNQGTCRLSQGKKGHPNITWAIHLNKSPHWLLRVCNVVR